MGSCLLISISLLPGLFWIFPAPIIGEFLLVRNSYYLLNFISAPCIKSQPQENPCRESMVHLGWKVAAGPTPGWVRWEPGGVMGCAPLLETGGQGLVNMCGQKF